MRDDIIDLSLFSVKCFLIKFIICRVDVYSEWEWLRSSHRCLIVQACVLTDLIARLSDSGYKYLASHTLNGK